MTATAEFISDSYALNHQPDGTSFTVRENLVDILQRELLGPVHGPRRCCRSARAHIIWSATSPR
ncbi:hypothetical protein [Candidatus Mycobacterium methanotrophicum]|uniref:Uncharacterized protein n=1 Tax=Candidatus Mycobacterium methanotrophicum TaxID=2943498 RepID=A0ABY4QNQ9_9MYCO|nr:hypothetical protein [Candidatus Mycobacterium methanotrophicum]UQX12137.1 hypothetical protein M5I08_07500 [Candidatus Mycobacterium methanotrophicum]